MSGWGRGVAVDLVDLDRVGVFLMRWMAVGLDSGIRRSSALVRLVGGDWLGEGRSFGRLWAGCARFEVGALRARTRKPGWEAGV